MKLFLSILTVFCCLNAKAINDPDMAQIREKFYKLTFNSADTELVLNEVRLINNKTGVILAYEAALEALMAKGAWNPFSKINHVKLSKAIFDQAIKIDPTNIEIRFIRFSVEYHIPKWLGLSKNMQLDKDYIIKNNQSFNVSCISRDMIGYIKKFVNESGWYSEGELARISEVTGT